MKILICGASGFVGRHLAQTLQRAGHTIIRAVRTPQQASDIAVNFCTDTDASVWLPRLHDIDVVINTVGVLRDSKENPMQKLHLDTPSALFQACALVNIKRIVHISALGVDSGVDVPYFSTRLQAEHLLRELPAQIRSLCLRPSVIYGADGASAILFRTLAKLPIQALPLGGTQTLQPVHIDNICQAVTSWLADTHAESQLVNAVGADATTMRGMLDSYREQLHRSPAWHLALPQWITWLMAKIGDHIPASPMCSDIYAMLAVNNSASSREFSRLLGKQARSYRDFIREHL